MHDNGSSVESVQEFRVAMVDHWMDVKNRLKMRILSFQFQEAGHTDLESRKNTTFTIITLNVFVVQRLCRQICFRIFSDLVVKCFRSSATLSSVGSCYHG